jgi:hypothetical protein
VARRSDENSLSIAEAQRGKVSQLMLDFARPLLDLMGPPRTIDDLRRAFELTTMCWNLSVFERERFAEATAMREHFDATVRSCPAPLASALLRLAASRTAEFAQVPFMVVVEIRGSSLDDCTLFAEAHSPS